MWWAPDRTTWTLGVASCVAAVAVLYAALAGADPRGWVFLVAGLVGVGVLAVVFATRRERRIFADLERRMAARTLELEASEGKFRRIFETMADGYTLSRLPDGRYVDANPAAAQILGFPSIEALLERRVVDLYANLEDRDRILAALGAGTEFRALEIEMKRFDGSHAHLLINGRILADAQGQPAFVEANFFDMSAQKAAEKVVHEARDAAEQANRAKSAFLANMSHELRTPMNAILGYSEMLIEEAEDDGNESAAADLEKIHAAGKHLLALINDVLDLSKIEAGKMDLYLESFEIGAMVEGVASTVETLVKKNANRLRVEVDPALGLMHADLTKVRQALLNLLSNAAKFTREGEIALIVERQLVDDTPWVHMSVSDSGIGIPPDKIESVFEEFSQADESTSRDYGGTGLGLPISRRFCQMMGGEITVKSRPGEGSTFTVRLPVRVETPAQEVEPAEQIGESPAEEAPRPTEVATVLVVDDDAQALELLGRTLQGAGLRVVTASDGRGVQRLARTLRPMAITLDVEMPGMDGWEVLAELKGDPETRDIPVIMITMTDDRETGYALGATEFLTKPIDRGSLLHLLQRYAPPEAEPYALVVDDDLGSREMLRSALEREGWQVAEAENGRRALERLDERKPSLILLDLMMPVMDGFEFLMQMRKLEEWRGIPIVVVTAKDLSETDRSRLNGDVVGLIRKGGLDRNALLAELQEQLADIGRCSG